MIDSKNFSIGNRVIVNETAGFHRGARGEIKFIEPSGQTIWVHRDGSSSLVYYRPNELDLDTRPILDKWDLRFLRLAREVSMWSKDPSTQVGAVLVSPDKRKVSHGYNGFPHGMSDDPALYANRDEKYSRIIHAEKNAKNNALCMGTTDLNNWTMYTWPFASCDRCFVEIADAGVIRFVAPKPSKEIASRWDPILEKTRQYAAEMKRSLEEVDLPDNF
jgi:dCMP deaminase